MTDNEFKKTHFLRYQSQLCPFPFHLRYIVCHFSSAINQTSFVCDVLRELSSRIKRSTRKLEIFPFLFLLQTFQYISRSSQVHQKLFNRETRRERHTFGKLKKIIRIHSSEFKQTNINNYEKNWQSAEGSSISYKRC